MTDEQTSPSTPTEMSQHVGPARTERERQRDERIAELEAENEQLQECLMADGEKFQQLIESRQQAEQRIAELEALWHDATCLLGKAELQLAEAREHLLTFLNSSAQCPECGRAVYRIPMDGHRGACRLAAVLKETP